MGSADPMVIGYADKSYNRMVVEKRNDIPLENQQKRMESKSQPKTKDQKPPTSKPHFILFLRKFDDTIC